MPDSDRKVTVHLRQAHYQDELKDQHKRKTLEQYMRKAYELLPNTNHRRFATSSKVIEGINYKLDKNCVFIAIATYEENTTAATLEKGENKTQANIGQVTAPFNNEFIKEHVFAVIRGNSVLYCAVNSREHLLVDYLQRLFSNNNFPEIASFISLRKKANVDKLKMIEKEGVKEIRLNISMDQVYKISESDSNFSAKFGKFITGIFNGFPSMKDSEKLANSTAMVVIKVHKSYGSSFIKAALNNTATELVGSDSPDFCIITNSGTPIKSDELAIKREVLVARAGNTVDTNSTWRQLYSVLRELSEDGHIG